MITALCKYINRKSVDMRERASRKERFIVNTICFSIIAAALFAVFLRFVNSSIEPAALEISSHQAKQETIDIINRSASELITLKNSDYGDFASIVYDENGNIASIQTLTANVNMFQTELSERINDDLRSGLNKVIEVPVGSVSGVNLFSGKGPKLKVKVIPIGDVSTTLRSEFTSAGINQTRHRIIVDVSVDITTIMPLEKKTVIVDYEYVIAETVIVGKVPENFLNVPQNG